MKSRYKYLFLLWNIFTCLIVKSTYMNQKQLLNIQSQLYWHVALFDLHFEVSKALNTPFKRKISMAGEYTLDDLAKMLRINPRTIRNYIQQGLLRGPDSLWSPLNT